MLRLHEDPLAREELIRSYLKRRLDRLTSEAFEAHYLSCNECFDELRTTDRILSGLTNAAVVRRERDRVVVIDFSGPAQLVRESPVARQLEGILHQGDSRVLVDLSKVSRIDSAGLGVLMTCYSHVLRNRGMLKVLRPSEDVRRLLSLTRLDGVVEAFDDETAAIQSFTN
ncbi:MAG TPA: STAS domain-containing protein [Bryobacteraceae bacterium]|nr:STAS domain-containing protein [Bryobacteraceae bacterium]